MSDRVAQGDVVVDLLGRGHTGHVGVHRPHSEAAKYALDRSASEDTVGHLRRRPERRKTQKLVRFPQTRLGRSRQARLGVRQQLGVLLVLFYERRLDSLLVLKRGLGERLLVLFGL